MEFCFVFLSKCRCTWISGSNQLDLVLILRNRHECLRRYKLSNIWSNGAKILYIHSTFSLIRRILEHLSKPRINEQTIRTINVLKPTLSKGTFRYFQPKQDTTHESQRDQWVEEGRADILKDLRKYTPDLKFIWNVKISV